MIKIERLRFRYIRSMMTRRIHEWWHVRTNKCVRPNICKKSVFVVSVRNINICGRILTQSTGLLWTNTIAAKRDLLAERTGLGKSVSVSLCKNGPYTLVKFHTHKSPTKREFARSTHFLMGPPSITRGTTQKSQNVTTQFYTCQFPLSVLTSPPNLKGNPFDTRCHMKGVDDPTSPLKSFAGVIFILKKKSQKIDLNRLNRFRFLRFLRIDLNGSIMKYMHTYIYIHVCIYT